MKQYIGCDAHKKYSVFETINEKGNFGQSVKVPHDREMFRSYLRSLPPGSSIAVESIGNWYWLIDEMECAGHLPILTHARKAKLMLGQINKTDQLDARGLAVLNRNGTVPSVWIPSGELRDQRELLRMRMTFVSIRTKLKNRILSTLAKYNIRLDEVSDAFGVKGRSLILESLNELPPETRESVRQELHLLKETEERIQAIEARIEEVISPLPEVELLKTLPGVGPILSTVIALEIGDVNRFPGPDRLASYSGTTPRVRSSGGKTSFGKVRSDVNRYLKWAFVEAANLIVLHQKRMPERHVVRLYQRLRKHKGHAKAAVAVARHLAEASFWMLKNKEIYHEPVSSTQRQTRNNHEPLMLVS